MGFVIVILSVSTLAAIVIESGMRRKRDEVEHREKTSLHQEDENAQG